MQIWMGKFCRNSTLAGLIFCICSCGTAERHSAAPEQVPSEVSLKEDKATIDRLRKDVPEEVKQSNDRLSDTLNRWRAQKMEPERLREKFSDEIRKIRNMLDSKQHKAREDFQRNLAEKRRNFLDKLKSDRDSFYSSKPTSEQRSDYSTRQQSERDRFFDEERDAREEFDGTLKDERKSFEDDIEQRWVEFRQEFPEYSRVWREMKADEEKKRDENANNPKSYNGTWPYKFPGEENGSSAAGGVSSGAPSGAGQAQQPHQGENYDVNKGGDGWPSSDPSEFDRLHGKGPQGNQNGN